MIRLNEFVYEITVGKPYNVKFVLDVNSNIYELKYNFIAPFETVGPYKGYGKVPVEEVWMLIDKVITNGEAKVILDGHIVIGDFDVGDNDSIL